MDTRATKRDGAEMRMEGGEGGREHAPVGRGVFLWTLLHTTEPSLAFKPLVSKPFACCCSPVTLDRHRLSQGRARPVYDIDNGARDSKTTLGIIGGRDMKDAKVANGKTEAGDGRSASFEPIQSRGQWIRSPLDGHGGSRQGSRRWCLQLVQVKTQVQSATVTHKRQCDAKAHSFRQRRARLDRLQ